MKRIAILGCENSHSNNFLDAIRENEAYSDYEIVGVYSDEKEAVEKLNAEYGAPIMASYDELVGKIDALIITARHGANHYKYAKPYIKSGIPMFIDKPITIDCDEAVEFMRELREAGVRICGGSSLSHAEEMIALKQSAEAKKDGETIGGIVRAPLLSSSTYGGFYFYAQHLVEMVSMVFGRYPKAVKAYSVENQKTVVFRYEKYDIVGIFTENSYKYFAARFSEGGSEGGIVEGSPNWFKREFKEFDDLLRGGEQILGYDEFISSVFVIDAIKKSLESGEEVAVAYSKV